MTREKTQSSPSSEREFFFALWCLGAIKFFEVVLLNKNRICIGRGTSDGGERLARRAKNMGGLGNHLWGFRGSIKAFIIRVQ
jgi:hypothetical protein